MQSILNKKNKKKKKTHRNLPLFSDDVINKTIYESNHIPSCELTELAIKFKRKKTNELIEKKKNKYDIHTDKLEVEASFNCSSIKSEIEGIRQCDRIVLSHFDPHSLIEIPNCNNAIKELGKSKTPMKLLILNDS